MTDMINCPECDGRGQFDTSRDPERTSYQRCDLCEGEGKVVEPADIFARKMFDMLGEFRERRRDAAEMAAVWLLERLEDQSGEQDHEARNKIRELIADASPGALDDWRREKLDANRSYITRKRVAVALAEVMQPEAIPAWMQTQIPAFENRTPNELIVLGYHILVMQAIDDLRSGTPV
jgi:hypothetical protein